MRKYSILMHGQTFGKAESYLEDIRARKVEPGGYLRRLLEKDDIRKLDAEGFVELLLRTKRPRIFAESAVRGDGWDWNQDELSILGDIAVAVPVTVYDDGRHWRPGIHPEPFPATLLYVPGALLRNGSGNTPADWEEATTENGNRIDPEGYFSLYERRLLPCFSYANSMAESNGRQALVTIPGLGCGQFAGPFHGQLGTELRNALERFLKTHGERFPNIRAVYYDPYRECQNERLEIGGLSFMIRPLTQRNDDKPQLCPPRKYEEDGDDFGDCDLFSLVAWDHVSWPGNDFYGGARATDDGVKGAATDSMAVVVGIQGVYDPVSNSYNPPEQYIDWEDAVRKNGIQLLAKSKLRVFPKI